MLIVWRLLRVHILFQLLRTTVMNKLPYLFSLLVLLSTTFHASPSLAQDRKGWGPQAKGAVIRGGSGAILGAVINKRNRAVGGVVGGGRCGRGLRHRQTQRQ